MLKKFKANLLQEYPSISRKLLSTRNYAFNGLFIYHFVVQQHRFYRTFKTLISVINLYARCRTNENGLKHLQN